MVQASSAPRPAGVSNGTRSVAIDKASPTTNPVFVFYWSVRGAAGVPQDRVRRVLHSSATPIDKRNTKAAYRLDCPLDEKQKYRTKDTPTGHTTNSQCGRTASTHQPSIAATSRNATTENTQRAKTTKKKSHKLAHFHIRIPRYKKRTGATKK